MKSPVFVSFIIFAAITHTEECEPMTASIGEELQFTCHIITCNDGGFEWFQVTQSKDLLLPNTRRTLTINVTSVMEFGGDMYKCQCRGSSIHFCFVVWVNPVITLTFSNSTIEAGASANVTCLAESYPPANSSSNYTIQHPIGETLLATQFIPGKGVIHPIGSATCADSGLYMCHVQVNDKVSNDKTGSLIVYESSTPCGERTPVPTLITTTGTSELIVTSTFKLIVTSTLTPSTTVALPFTPTPSQTCGCQSQVFGLGIILGTYIIGTMI